jgi:hypothetical protein
MKMVEPKNDSETEQAESAKERHKKLLKLLENEIWPQIPSSQLGVRLSKTEEEKILGFEE